MRVMIGVYFIPAFFLLLFLISVAAAAGPQVAIALAVEVDFVDVSLLVEVMVGWGAGGESGIGAMCVGAVVVWLGCSVSSWVFMRRVLCMGSHALVSWVLVCRGAKG